MGIEALICLSEAKEKEFNSRNRLDILIINSNTYVLELCANVEFRGAKDSIESHLSKTAKYPHMCKSGGE